MRRCLMMMHALSKYDSSAQNPEADNERGAVSASSSLEARDERLP